MTPLFCGVDAGGTSSRAALVSADGSVLGWGAGPGANPNHAGWEGAGSAMRQTVEAACQSAGTRTSSITSLFLGMAGVISASDRQQASAQAKKWNLSPTCFYGVDHDIRIALQGGLSGRPGIALIAGTGSACYGRNAQGESWQAGGWDMILDDLGSAYDLARRGMTAACQSADGRLKKSALQEILFSALGVTNIVDFTVKVHRPALPRHVIAALAAKVLQAAEAGDLAALKIVTAGADELARMVEAVARQLFKGIAPEIVPIGGLIEKSGSYHSLVETALKTRLPSVRLTSAELRPVVGAVAIAAEQIKQPLDLSLLQKLSSLAKD